MTELKQTDSARALVSSIQQLEDDAEGVATPAKAAPGSFDTELITGREPLEIFNKLRGIIEVGSYKLQSMSKQFPSSYSLGLIETRNYFAFSLFEEKIPLFVFSSGLVKLIEDCAFIWASPLLRIFRSQIAITFSYEDEVRHWAKMMQYFGVERRAKYNDSGQAILEQPEIKTYRNVLPVNHKNDGKEIYFFQEILAEAMIEFLVMHEVGHFVHNQHFSELGLFEDELSERLIRDVLGSSGLERQCDEIAIGYLVNKSVSAGVMPDHLVVPQILAPMLLLQQFRYIDNFRQAYSGGWPVRESNQNWKNLDESYPAHRERIEDLQDYMHKILRNSNEHLMENQVEVLGRALNDYNIHAMSMVADITEGRGFKPLG